MHKYIIVKGEKLNKLFVFSGTTNHSDILNEHNIDHKDTSLNISAGFIYMDDDEYAGCGGYSHTLGLKSSPLDSSIISQHFSTKQISAEIHTSIIMNNTVFTFEI